MSKQHVIEPYELQGAARGQFWEDTLFAAARVARVVHPVKVNYEIHGNTVPHLHVHVFPRYHGDPFEEGPIDPHTGREFVRSAADIETLRRAIANPS